MVERSAGEQARRARWIGYAAFGWALAFSLVHLYWGLEGATAGRLIVPGGAIAAGDRGDSSAWVGLGVAMTFYGCVYLVAAIGEIHTELFLAYLITGGVSWFSGGALFMATAWLSTRRKASRTTPAPFVAESVRLRSRKSGSPQETTDTAENRSVCLRAERRTS